jgi:hypothetical protein
VRDKASGYAVLWQKQRAYFWASAALLAVSALNVVSVFALKGTWAGAAISLLCSVAILAAVIVSHRTVRLLGGRSHASVDAHRPCADPCSVPLDQLLEATRDLIGILRAMYASEQEPTRRIFANAAKAITAAAEIAKVEPEGSEAYRRAMNEADAAINTVANTLHFNASLPPVLGAAAGRVRKARG